MHVLRIDIVFPMCDRFVGVKACVVPRAQLLVVFVSSSVPQGHSLDRYSKDNYVVHISSVIAKKEGREGFRTSVKTATKSSLMNNKTTPPTPAQPHQLSLVRSFRIH